MPRNRLIRTETASEIFDYRQTMTDPRKSCQKSQDRQALQKTCRDCGEKLELYSILYRDNKYCKECYEDIKDICSACGKEDSSNERLYVVNIEGDYIGDRRMCKTCFDGFFRCERDGCNVIFKGEKICEQCELNYCKLHTIEHQCKGNEPSHIFRDVSRNYFHGDRAKAKEIKIPWLVGVELEAVNGDPESLILKLDGNIGVSHDGSLQGRQPIEMQLPPSSNDLLERFIKNATKSARNAGFKVNRTCGVHIHLDAAGRINGEYVYKLLSTYYAIEPVIFAMLPKSRSNNKYALPLRNWVGETKMFEMSRRPNHDLHLLQTEWYKSRSGDSIDRYIGNRYDSSRYHGFNLHSLFKNGTFEMRYHHGSLNRVKILNWINFHLMVATWVDVKFNQNVVDAIFEADSIQDKLKIMNRHFKFNKTIRRYISRNINKFANNDVDDGK